MTRELKTRLHATAHRRRKKIYRISRSESNGFCDSSKSNRYSRRWPVKSARRRVPSEIGFSSFRDARTWLAGCRTSKLPGTIAD